MLRFTGIKRICKEPSNLLVAGSIPAEGAHFRGVNEIGALP